MASRFRDRAEAGRALARLLTAYADRPDALVLALPRGGVPVGYEVATALGLPLDVLVVRKLGVPGHEELAMGAIASGGAVVVNDEVVRAIRIPDAVLAEAIEIERRELRRRELAYRGDRPPPQVTGRTVLLVDDGLATGSTMRAAVLALRERAPASVVVAAPTAAAATVTELGKVADEVVCVAVPRRFVAVGLAYELFDQTTDEEVSTLLARAAARPASAG